MRADKRRTREDWRAIVKEYKESGQSHKEFCVRRKLVVGTFQQWLYRLRREEGRPQDVRLLPVDVASVEMARGEVNPSAPTVVLIAVCGVELRVGTGTDVGYVTSLVKELRVRC
jgi:hypothetical protein